MSDSLEYFGVAPLEYREVENRADFTAAAGQTIFSFIYQVGYLDITRNGATLSVLAGDATAANGTTFILTVPCIAGETIQARSRRQVPVSDSYTQSQINSLNNNYYGVGAGTGDAVTTTTTPSVGFTQTDGREVKVRWPAANTSTTPTIVVNGNSAVGVRQAGGQNVPIGSLAPNQELTLRYNSTSGFYEIVVSSALLQIPLVKRQTVASGPLDVNGYANEIGVGTALAPTINGATTPVVTTFAAGFGPNGAIDYVGYINSLLSFPSVPVSALAYLTIDRNTSTGALTLGSTMAPPQYGTTYTQNAQSVLQFGGAAGGTTFLDDFGNTWTAQGGAKVQTNQIKFGTGALGGGGTLNALNGTSDSLRSSSFTTLGSGSWALRIHRYLTSNTTLQAVFSADNGSGSSGYGAQVYTNTGGKLSLYLSSTGSSFDLANASTGATTVTTGQYHFIELTYDAVAGKYFLYLDGVLEITVTSALRICNITGIRLGSDFSSNFATGYIDKFEYLPYCQHPNGTTYTVPTAAPNVATQGYTSDWFNTSNYTMYQVSAASTIAGTNPTFAPKQRLYVGEATAGASTVSSVVSYAYNRYYESPLYGLALSGVYINNHNVGSVPKKQRTVLVNTTPDIGYIPGDEVDGFGIQSSASNSNGFTPSLSNKTITIATGGASVVIIQKSGNSAQNIIPANWKFKSYVEGF